VCRTCKLEKPLDQFWKNNVHCIECSKAKYQARLTLEKRKQYADRGRKFDELNIARYLLRYARKRAKAKGLECTIRPRDIHVPDRCPIFDVPLVKNTGTWSNNSYSLDRIDSSKGYVPGNVRVISWQANSLKSNTTVEQVERLLKYMKGEI
jgi:hypothetical protein